MYGDSSVGSVLRQMRRTRSLTLAAVARRVGCTHSQLSQVETGSRALLPWLALALDDVYGSGAGISTLLQHSARPAGQQGAIVMIIADERGTPALISRRSLLAALALGTTLDTLGKVISEHQVSSDDVERLRRTYCAIEEAGRTTGAHQLLDALVGHIGLVDALRRQARGRVSHDLLLLQTEAAESASWMAEEAGDATEATYWIDRAAIWAERVDWTAMVAYSNVRRGMLALTAANDGRAAVEHARHALAISNAPNRVVALAYKQMAYGHASRGDHNLAKYSLDRAISAFEDVDSNGHDAYPPVGQVDVSKPGLEAIYCSVVDVYLGGGSGAIDRLEPQLHRIADGSGRSHTITQARLAYAYANVGAPDMACEVAMAAIDSIRTIHSANARAEVRRAVRQLVSRWPNRSDVKALQTEVSAVRPGDEVR